MPFMTAMQIDAPGRPLRRVQRPVPTPGRNELLIRVSACGVCRTDLHVLDGEIAASYPIIPGHEIVGEVLEVGAEVQGFSPGQRVGVPWLGHSCGVCPYCLSDRENLCDHPEFTGANMIAASSSSGGRSVDPPAQRQPSESANCCPSTSPSFVKA